MWYRAPQKGAALKKELIHSRKISVNCYETDTERLIVEGFLTDERFFPYFIRRLSEPRDAGPIHHVALMMEMTLPEMKIVSIMAQMPVVPDPGCRDIVESVNQLEGHFIRPGFTTEVRTLFGKTSGCLHLTNLILAMSSAAVQGLWSYLSRVREGVVHSLTETDEAMLLDSCHMWRKEGPFAKDSFAQHGQIRKEILRGGKQCP
jgi:hypothetical protein